MKGRNLIIASLIAVLLVFGGIAYLYNHNRLVLEEAPKLPPISENETDPEVWGLHYPRHYESYRDAVEQPVVRTKYGGNDPFSKLEEFPEMKILFAGYGFGEEYKEERGHPYAVQDIGEIHEKRKKAGAVCLTCKSPEVPGLIEEFGDKYYSLDFYKVKDEYIKHSIGCSDCHDPKTMDLIITRPALREAFKEMGKDIDKASRQEMRTLVCAQCHVEYYFTKDKKIVTFPWGDSPEGMKPEKVYEYFKSGEYEENQFVDWTHPESQTPMLKAQHPDYEFFYNSTHQAAGVACADCHMPFIKQGNIKITSHWLVSPLRTLEQSCHVCHRDDTEYLKERVYHIQDNNYNLLKIAADRNVEAIEEIKAALNSPGADQDLIREAQELHRKAQWLWDWMSAENSMGFHNPAEGLNYIGKSIDFANKAIQTARESKNQ
ncbi:MAG: ammonia-forming cytochrome c nitrite reductase subunit c552 [Bacillota bacterium]